MTTARAPLSTTAAPDVLILGAGFDTGNRGVAALACGTLAAIFHAWPRAHVALLDYSKTPRTQVIRVGDVTHSVGLVPLRFSKNLFLPNHIARLLATAALLRLLPENSRITRINANPWLRPIAQAKVIGALSGGDSFSDLYGFRRLLYVSLPQLLVIVMGRPLVLLPQSFGPFRSWLARGLARQIIRNAAHIYTREMDGLDCIRRLAPDAEPRASIAYDMGFALEPHAPADHVWPPAAPSLLGRTLIGVNVSGLLYREGESPGSNFGLRAPYAALMREIVTTLAARDNCTIVLIPHVFGTGGESDVTAALQLWHSLPDPVAREVLVLTHELDQHEVKYIIGQCELFVGARMHACIAAISQAVPCVALAYSDKFRGVLSQLGNPQLVVDLRNENQVRIIATIIHALLMRQTLRANLETRNPGILRNVLDFFRPFAPAEATQPEATAPVLRPELDPA
jgi:colanic acid/amylovoran biosynthesis protein